MNIIIAGCGEVGRHAAEVLVLEGHHVTLIDRERAVLDRVGETLDVGTLVGLASSAEVLAEAGAARADLMVATTDQDEINLLGASVAKGLGTRKAIARVHHSTYHNRLGIDYAAHLHIDHLVCPEYLMSLEIAGVLRDPGVQAVEHFARGQVEMERLVISEHAAVAGKRLRDLRLPGGARVGTVTRGDEPLVPTGETVLLPGDVVTVICRTDTFERAQQMFRAEGTTRRRVVIMGGSSTAVWLARALTGRLFQVRVFVMEHERAQELSAKLLHATVLEADPTDPAVFGDENIATADAFVTLTDDDERNILAALQAKSLGVKRTVAVIQKHRYLNLVEQLGIDRVFSPRIVATREIVRLSQTRSVEELAPLAQGAAVFELRVASGSKAVEQSLAELALPAGCVLVAIQRGETIVFPQAQDVLKPNDAVVAIAPTDARRKLERLFS